MASTDFPKESDLRHEEIENEMKVGVNVCITIY